MARLTSAIFNKATGKVGNMILSNSYGNTVIARSVPTKTTNAPTNAQQTQRTLFTIVLSAALALSDLITQIFKPLKVYHSSYNSFMSSVIKYAIDHSKSSLSDILSGCFVTNGPAYSEDLTLVGGVTGTGIGDTEIAITVSFDTAVPSGDPKRSDKIYGLVFSPSLKLSKIFDTSKTRASSGPAISVITFNAPDNYIAFYFKDSVTGEASNSKCCGVYNSVTGVATLFNEA